MVNAENVLLNQGYVSLLSCKVAAACGALIDSMEALELDARRNVYRMAMEDWDGYSLEVITNPHRANTAFAEILALVGEELRSVGIMDFGVEGSYVVTKPSWRGMPIGWHQDAALDTYRDGNGRRLAAWIPLQDTDENNGGLWILERSHLGLLLAHEYYPLKKGSPQKRIRNVNTENQSSLILKAGSITLLHENLVHCSFGNVTDTPRHALVIDFVSK